MPEPYRMTEQTDEAIQFEARNDLEVAVYVSAIADPQGVRILVSDFYTPPHHAPPFSFKVLEQLVAWLQQKIAEHQLRDGPPVVENFVVDTIEFNEFTVP